MVSTIITNGEFGQLMFDIKGENILYCEIVVSRPDSRQIYIGSVHDCFPHGVMTTDCNGVAGVVYTLFFILVQTFCQVN